MFLVVGGGGSNSFNNVKEEETETLSFKMGKEGEENNYNNNNNINYNNNIVKVEDVEEGEISDTASVEEISEEVFNIKQEAVVVNKSSSNDNKDSAATTKSSKRVWTMSDLYRYQMGGGYVSGLYNLAWAQAVQSKPGGGKSSSSSSSKPLNELFAAAGATDVVEEFDENSKRSSPSSSIASVNSNNTIDNKDDDDVDADKKKVVDKVVIDDSGDEMDDDEDNNSNKVVVEKEEGELEEGEIDLDSEPGEKVVNNNSNNNGNGDDALIINDFMNVDGLEEIESKEKKINEILQALESVTVVEANKSFDAACSKLCNAFQSLRENYLPIKDDLKQVSLTAIQAINSVFSSMNYKLREQNKEIFSRLHTLVNSCVPSLFSPEHAKEIDVMLSSRDFSSVFSISIPSEKEKETCFSAMVNKMDNDVFGPSSGHNSSTMNKLPTDAFVNDKANISLEASKPGMSTFKSRAVLLPLLDLHKDHDANSLPSPTREAAPPLPVHRVLTPKAVLDTGNSRMHPYETDALKAVSTYQQKFSRNSFALTDRLPSPTPSEESGDGDGDMAGEVSSSSSAINFRSANSPTLGQAVAIISPTCSDGSNLSGAIPVKSGVPVSSAPSLTVKTSAKSRDPRLRFVNSDPNGLDQNQRALPVVSAAKMEHIGGTTSIKRQKSVDDPIADGYSLKKQRNALEHSGIIRDAKPVVGSGGWLEANDEIVAQTMNKNQLVDNAESDPRRTDFGGAYSSTGMGSGMSSVSISGNERIPITGTLAPTGGEQVPATGTCAASIPDLLKNIAVNPTMLINILKMGQQQQRLALDAQQKPVDPAKSTTHSLNSNSNLGTVSAASAAPPLSSGILARPAETVQMPSQLGIVDDLGKIRMKPRDPRRVLHNNALQRNGGMGTEHLKTSVTSSPINQETKDNQNVQKKESQVEIKPVPSPSPAPPDISMPFTKSLKNIADIVSVSHAPTSLPLVYQNLTSQPMQTITLNSDQSMGVSSAPGVAAAGPRPQNAWGDVERLFEGYNDQQRAAIQKERARRIEEQRKLFSARKLCLVLDLDHTLLNSAKFVEVDPVHDEILRKKEEQDREKPQRHLFRFPHMGMWTKLRPGIWNFLEKASKLYELHLYTMGNKLYATEMAKVLDPTGVLFNGRVISKGDDGEPFDGDERIPKSKDLEGVLGMESGVVIIDDSVRVWPHNKLNLIVVERYIYFPCSRRQFGLPGPSLLEIDHDERPDDGTLACSLAVIERIHKNFFTHASLDEADVRNILAAEQRKILAGCRIVFSRVFPVGEANPHLHPLWQTAEQFGAVCTNQIDDQVTHVVANSLGTDKVNWALSTGRFVVYPGWVEASALLYRRANEQDFTIKQ